MKKSLIPILFSIIFLFLCSGVNAGQAVKSMDFRISVYIPPIVGVNVSADYPGAIQLNGSASMKPETTIEHINRDNEQITLKTTVVK